jgi:CheY-like chemotaxis protein
MGNCLPIMNKEKLAVLIIEDEPDVARVAEAAMRRAGWEVNISLDAKSALKIAESMKPDAILCDANMPDMTGAQVIALLKSQPGTAQIPVVLMTGFAQADMFQHVEWTAFIEKPFAPRDLIDVLERAAQTVIPPRIE